MSKSWERLCKMAFATTLRVKYEKDINTLYDVLLQEDLPCVVQTVPEELQANNNIDLPTCKELLLQKCDTETFAHLRILRLENKEQTLKDKGAEFVLEHERFVGQEYLIPLSYPGEFKYVRRPGSRGRYCSVSQVPSDNPSHVRVEDETEARLSNDQDTTVKIPAKSILKVGKYSSNPKSNEKILECENNDGIYIFKENDLINFTAIDSICDSVHKLRDLKNVEQLPKTIQFKNLPVEDIVTTDIELSNALLTMADGPVEILDIITLEYLEIWLRNKAMKTFETAILPSALWKTVNVRIPEPLGEIKQSYILRKYGKYPASNFLSHSLYLMAVDHTEMVWVRSPELFTRMMNSEQTHAPELILYEDSSDDEKGYSVYADIEEPCPPLPPREAIRKISPITEKHNSFLDKIQRLTITAGVLSNISSLNRLNKERVPKRPPKLDHLRASLSADWSGLTLGDTLSQTDVFKSDTSRSSYSTLSRTLRFIRKKARLKRTFSEPDEQFSYLRSHSQEHEYGLTEVNRSDDENVTLREAETQQPGPVSLKTVEKVLKNNQTAEDFFGYSLEDTAFCFEYCGLPALSKMCHEQRLDGTFFRGLEKETFDVSLLNLSNFDAYLLRCIIFNGLRSNQISTSL